jgi:membrane protease YdiL (CAAX protease family)
MSILSLRCSPILLALPATQPVMPTTVPTAASGNMEILFLLMSLAGVLLFLGLHVWRPRSVIGPNRLPARGKTGVVLFSLAFGLFVWLFAQAAYGAYAMRQLKQQGVEHPDKHLMESPSPKDSAILSTVPFAAGFLVMLAALGSAHVTSRIGLGTRKLPLGIGAGILAFIVVFPAIMWATAVVEPIYQHYHYHHEAEHPLLKEFGQASQGWQGWRILIVVGALICAPFFEEFLFRGHLQTLLRHGFAKLAARGRTASIAGAETGIAPQTWLTNPPPPPPGVVPDSIAPIAAAPELPELPPQTAAWPSWLAILITATIFALVHPIWSAPLIFILAIGLGYVYERTGTLWSCITLHLLFNAVETLVYYINLPGH